MTERQDDTIRSICPYLGTVDEEGKPAPCVDYPSFENNCFVSARPEAIMLTDQATFCLSSGHRHCPRLTSELDASASRSGRSTGSSDANGFASGTSTDPLLHAIADMEEALEARRVAARRRKRRMGWIGIVAAFVSTILCGGMFAAYVGWQMVNRDAVVATAGTVTTLAEVPPTPAAQPLYLIVTATPDSPMPAAAASLPASSAEDNLPSFPAAVTATPMPNARASLSEAAVAVAGQVGPSTAQRAPTPAPPGSPALNMLVQIPTRRPTPVLDLAISVPTVPQATDVQSPTPLPPAGTPVVVFAAQDEALESGECTTVSWHVENVRAVYYENLGVDGHGEAEECLRNKAGDYILTVVMPNGSTQYYTVTVGLLLPTETPTPTPTRPPYVEPTATWTPVIPTDTPTPDVQYGVLLSLEDGAEHTCAPGDTCSVDVRVTNTSLGIDDISILFLQAGRWDANLCRLDGVCSDTKLTLASVGPSNTALVLLTVNIPDGASGRSESYTLQAVSEGSGGEAVSDAVSIRISAP